MNFIQKLLLRMKYRDDLEYKEELRKKQARELCIYDMAKKVARKKAHEKESRKDEKIYQAKVSEDLEITYKYRYKRYSSSSVYIHYKGEDVFKKYSGEIKKFTPCKWIDILSKEHKEIKEEENKEERKKKEDRWGIDRECDSKVFNKIA